MPFRDERCWRVGELASATGVTVRALHHYDKLGLLVPAERTAAGHRLYADAEVRRLYRIVALRQLGLRLEEIAAVLAREDSGLIEVVRRHLEGLSATSTTSNGCGGAWSRSSRLSSAPLSPRWASSSTRWRQ